MARTIRAECFINWESAAIKAIIVVLQSVCFIITITISYYLGKKSCSTSFKQMTCAVYTVFISFYILYIAFSYHNTVKPQSKILFTQSPMSEVLSVFPFVISSHFFVTLQNFIPNAPRPQRGQTKPAQRVFPSIVIIIKPKS